MILQTQFFNKMGKLCIVAFDLDNTLFYYNDDDVRPRVHTRPNANSLLCHLLNSGICVGVFTAANRAYAFEMLEACFGLETILKLFFIITQEDYNHKYEKTVNTIFNHLRNTHHIGDLQMLDKHNTCTILVDDLAENALDYNFRIIVKPYGGSYKGRYAAYEASLWNNFSQTTFYQLRHHIDIRYPSISKTYTLLADNLNVVKDYLDIIVN